MFDPQKRPVPHSLLPVPATSSCAFLPDMSNMRKVRIFSDIIYSTPIDAKNT